MPQIEVAFDIDANGIVNVSARDKGTNKEQRITIQASGGLSDADIERMVKEAEENAETDKKRKELVEARNQAESLIHATEKSVKEHGDRVDEATRGLIAAAVTNLKSVIEGEDTAEIREKSQALAEASMKLGEAIYKAQAEEEAASEASDSDNIRPTDKDDDIVDAEFEEVEDDKKA
jgi:molecular chaperone DnaK